MNKKDTKKASQMVVIFIILAMLALLISVKISHTDQITNDLSKAFENVIKGNYSMDQGVQVPE